MKKRERKKTESVTFNDQGLRKIRKASKGDIIHEVSCMGVDALRKTLIACELSRREGWKNHYDDQKEIRELTKKLAIERSRACNICPICFGAMHEADKSTESCGHQFHKGCFEAYRQGVFSGGDTPEASCPLKCDDKRK